MNENNSLELVEMSNTVLNDLVPSQMQEVYPEHISNQDEFKPNNQIDVNDIALSELSLHASSIVQAQDISHDSIQKNEIQEDEIQEDEIALNINNPDKYYLKSALLKRDPTTTKKKKVRRFYKEQNAFVDEIYHIYEDPQDDGSNENKRKSKLLILLRKLIQYDTFCLTLSFLSNFCIFCIKLAASIFSGSLALLASTIDSSLDLVSGLILFIANRLRHRRTSRDYLRYPLGKSRLEPIAFIIFACVVCTATLQVTISSFQTILLGAINQINGNDAEVPYVDNGEWVFWFSLGTLVGVSTYKLILHIICRFSRTPSVQAYAQDHKNDVIFNTALAIAVGCGSLSKYIWWFDPFAALLVSLYILQGWIRNIIEYVKKLVGFSADSKTISKLTHLAYAHDSRILFIDTVRASYVGLGLWVEVDIVLPENMPLKEAHDIGESLQKKIEAQEDVERAWVHLDHEYEHSPHAEHKKPE